MGLFGASSQFDGVVEKATSDKNTAEDWSSILDVCDKVGKSSPSCKECLQSIIKRLNNSDPHVAIQAVTLLDACVNNCGKNFHLEIASRDFETEYRKLLKKCHNLVAQKLRESLKKWAEGEFKSDPQLSLIPALYNSLKKEGQDFNSEMPVKKSAPLSKDPDVVTSQEEEDQIAKAIELSLRESSGSPRTTANSTLYPSTNLGSVTTGNSSSNATAASAVTETRKVRALYDFEAAEDNELTFNAGEIIHVIDDTDPNWWKGQNQRGEGLFPANFVTADLSVEPEQFKIEQNKKTVHFAEASAKVEKEEPEEVEINEEKIDRLLYLLHEADPTDPQQDPPELTNLESEVNSMGPLIDAELERVDRKHAQLTQLSTDLVEALNLYHTLMREPSYQTINKAGHYGPYPPPPHMAYNGVVPLSGMPHYMPQPGPGPQFPGMPGHQERPVFMPHPGPPPQTPSQQTGAPPGAPGQSMTLPHNFHMQQPPTPQNAMNMQPPPGMATLPRTMPPHSQQQPPPLAGVMPPPGMMGPPSQMYQTPHGMHQMHDGAAPPFPQAIMHNFGQNQSGFQPISGPPSIQPTSMGPQSGHFTVPPSTPHIM